MVAFAAAAHTELPPYVPPMLLETKHNITARATTWQGANKPPIIATNAASLTPWLG